MVPERVRTITTATYEAVDTDQEFTLPDLKDVLHRLKVTAPGDDTVCYLMIKNTPLAPSDPLLLLSTHSLDLCLWGESDNQATPSLQRVLSTNPGVTMWCVYG